MIQTKQSDAIHVMVTATVKPGKEQELQNLLNYEANESRKEPGCLRFDVMRDAQNTRKWYAYEIYKNPQVFADHRKTKHFASFMAFKKAGGFEGEIEIKVADSMNLQGFAPARTFELLGDYGSQPTRSIFALATINSDKMNFFIKEVNIGMLEQYKPEFKKINPVAKVPAMREINPGEADFNMFES